MRVSAIHRPATVGFRPIAEFSPSRFSHRDQVWSIPDVEKSAVAILRRGRVYVQRYMKTTAGLSIAHGPVRASASSDPFAVGDDLRAVLMPPDFTLPHPAQHEWRNVQQPMLDAAGVRSWKALAQGSLALGIECTGDVVSLIPSAHYENEGGRSQPNRTVQVEIASSDLGEKMLAAFAACD